MKKDLLLFGMAREGSKRLEDKMLRPFGNTTLFNIYLDKLIELSEKENSPFSKVILALNKNDRRLWTIATKIKSLEVVERNDFSVKDATKPSDLFHFLDKYDEEYVVRLNGCFPFLTPETIINISKYFLKHDNIKTLTCVKECNNWFWNPATSKPVTLLNRAFTTTQQSKMLYESVHCFHILNRDSLLEDVLWKLKPNDPYLYVVSDSIEFLDIDTEIEFKICEAVWKVYEELWKKK